MYVPHSQADWTKRRCIDKQSPHVHLKRQLITQRRSCAMLTNRLLRTALTLCGWLVAAILLSVQFGSKEPVLKFKDGGSEEGQLKDRSLHQTSTPLLSTSRVPTQTAATNVSNSTSGGFTLTRVPPPPSMVILLTYMRSGSSFTGDVIQQHPDVIYWYEPLHALNALMRSPLVNIRRMFLEKPPSIYKKDQLRNHSLEIIENVLTCQYQDIDIISLLGSHFVGFSSRKLLAFRDCYMSKGVVRTHHECLPATLQDCSSSALSLVKTIRFSMEDAGVLLSKYPSLKIIHLIRDPRPTLYSQSRTGGVDIGDFENGTRQFCARVYADLQESKRLSGRHPGRILTIRYDDIAESPQEGVAALYNFLGLEFDSERRQYVRNHTEMGLPDDCVICTLRANSTATANKWRHEISEEHLAIVQKHCVPVFKDMGYLPLSSKKVKDGRFPSKTKPTPFGSG